MRIRGRRIVKTPPPPPTSSVGSSEDPPAQQDEQEDTAGGLTEDAYKEISDSYVTPRKGKVSNAVVPAQQIVIVISSDEDEPALRSKVDPDEVTSKRIRRRIDSRDVNMRRSNCTRNEMTQVGHARVRSSGVARARGMHNLMPSRPKTEEELVKNVYGEAKAAQRKRVRLLREFYGV